MTLLVVPFPPSMWNGARVDTDSYRQLGPVGLLASSGEQAS